MRVDLGEHDGLEGLPRFQMAVQQVRRLGRLMYVSGGVGAFGLLLALSIDLFSPGSLWMAEQYQRRRRIAQHGLSLIHI